ncbi:MAG: shikimate kinase, partial [Candidatus Riflebacteria bacterium]|nr:shikimate kinase [Candidatus Riflebacteria bacterium]
MATPTIVVITGFMAAGKTAAAFEVAASKRWQLIDLDRSIEESSGKSIALIFAEDGESVFRQLERCQLEKALSADGCARIVAAGGGVVLSVENQHLLRQAQVVFLDTDFAEILRRLRSDNTERPLIQNLDDDRIRQLWQTRRPLYMKTSDYVVKDK